MIRNKILLAVALIATVIIFIPTKTDASTTLLYANPAEYQARIITGNSSSVRVDFSNTGNSSVTIKIGNSYPIPLSPGQSTYYTLDGNSTYYLSLSSSGRNVPVRASVSNGYIERGW